MKLSKLALFAIVKSQDVDYDIPQKPLKSIFFETFDSPNALDLWSLSRDEKYSGGKWAIEGLSAGSFSGDTGLVLKEAAKHHALCKETERFDFTDDLVIQYEVSFQSGIECGGAYMKLLTESDDDIEGFNDRTPFTIMFGPDKCGADYKYHFIFRYANPLTGEVQEYHPKTKIDIQKLEKAYKDKKSHLFTLKLTTGNSFELLMDNTSLLSGNLLDDITPPIVPPKEIPDPTDSKPESWDERERIEDPDAVKPSDWDETAPPKIIDTSAVMPSGWLVDEPAMIPEPNAVMPEDWDEEMDGEFEPPSVPNPVCADAPGCGEWEAPLVNNPAYKGKWKPKLIANPDYQGKWAPRSVANPDYFEDLTPFKSLKPFNRIGFELWTLSADIYIDNIIITTNSADATALFDKTTGLRRQKLTSWFESFTTVVENHPWLIALSVVIFLTVLITCLCCRGSSKEDDIGMKKKTDELTPDDPHTDENNEESNKEESTDEEEIQEDAEKEEADSEK